MGFLTEELTKLPFYTIFISVVSVILVFILSIYLSRTIESENIEFILAKNYVENKFLENGVTTSEDLDQIFNIPIDEYGLKVFVGYDSYILKPRIYEDNVLCDIKGSRVICSKKYHDFYLVDDELKRVEIDLVKNIW